ncbi:TonB family protein [Campylobacter mucosalis]|uniref:TonB family protein n=1 Tax=Campylobacter mucosalis TaxID=202 RepID=UPI00147076D0|nr:energy transducer TonB [Campylobacter mucosalis]
MKASKLSWFNSFLFACFIHALLFAFLIAKNDVKISNNLGGFDYPIKDDVFESIAIVSDLPIGEFKEVAPNLVQNKQETPKPEPEPEILAPLQEIKSEISVPKKEKKPKKIVKKTQKIKKEIETKTQVATQSPINSVAKDDVASAPVSGEGTKIASNSSGASKTQVKSYQGLVMSHLNKHKRYPKQALLNNEEETIKVRIVMDKNGKIISANLKDKAKYELLAREATELFYRASPLPKPPADFIGENETISINIPIEFNIKKFKQYK